MTKSYKKVARAHWWDDPEEEEQRGKVGQQRKPCWRRAYRSSESARSRSLVAEYRNLKESFPHRPDVISFQMKFFMRQRYSYFPQCVGGDQYAREWGRA